MSETTEDRVTDAIVAEKLDNRVSMLHEACAGVPTVDASSVELQAELMTIKNIMVRQSVISPRGLMEEMTTNIDNAIATLAESGLIDISATEDSVDELAGD